MVLESMIFRRNHIKKGERKLTYQKYVSSEIFFTWLDAIILLVKPHIQLWRLKPRDVGDIEQ